MSRRVDVLLTTREQVGSNPLRIRSPVVKKHFFTFYKTYLHAGGLLALAPSVPKNQRSIEVRSRHHVQVDTPSPTSISFSHHPSLVCPQPLALLLIVCFRRSVVIPSTFFSVTSHPHVISFECCRSFSALTHVTPAGRLYSFLLFLPTLVRGVYLIPGCSEEARTMPSTNTPPWPLIGGRTVAG